MVVIGHNGAAPDDVMRPHSPHSTTNTYGNHGDYPSGPELDVQTQHRGVRRFSYTAANANAPRELWYGYPVRIREKPWLRPTTLKISQCHERDGAQPKLDQHPHFEDEAHGTGEQFHPQ